MAELSALNVRITGDSTGLRTATQEAAKAVDNLGDTAQRTQAKVSGFGGGMSRVARSFNAHSSSIRLVSYQVQDLAVQLASGTRASVAFAQQGPQIASAFGPVGAVVGALAAVGIPALAFAFSTFNATAQTTEETLKAVGEAVDDLGSAIEQMQTPLYELIDKFGVAGLRVATLNRHLVQLKTIQATEEVTAGISALTSELDKTMKTLNGLVMMSEADMSPWMVKMKEDIGLTNDELNELITAYHNLQNAEGPVAVARAASDLADALSMANLNANNLPEPLRAALEPSIQLALKTQELAQYAQIAKDTVSTLGDNIPGPDWLAGPIAGVQALIAPLVRAVQLKGALFGTGFETPNNGLQGGRSAGVGGPTSDEMQKNNPFAQLAYSYGNAGTSASGSKGGGGSQTNPLQAELEALQKALMTAEQLEMESYQRRQELLQEALQQRLLTTQEYASLMEQVEASHQFAMTQSVNKGVSSALSALGQLFQGSKAIGAGIALANAWLAFSEVLKDPAYAGRPWARFAAAAKALAAGMSAVRGIQNSSRGGASGGASAEVGSAPQQTFSQHVAIQLTGGPTYTRDQVISLINEINSAVDDGAVIRVV